MITVKWKLRGWPGQEIQVELRGKAEDIRGIARVLAVSGWTVMVNNDDPTIELPPELRGH